MLKLPPYIISSAVNWLSKLINAGMQILIIPLLIRFLGIHDFALYNFILGVIGWFALCDLSTGIFCQNKITKMGVDHIDDSEIIAYSFYLNIFLIIAFSLLMLLVSPLIYKLFLVKLYGGSSQYLLVVWIIASTLYLANMVFQNTIKVFYVKDLAFKVNLLNLIVLTASFSAIYVMVHFDFTMRLLWVILASVVPILITNFLLYLSLVDAKIRLEFSRFKQFALETIYEARHFFLFGLNAALVLQLDYFIIAYFLSPQDLIQYNFCAKVFAAAFYFFSIVLLNYYPESTRLVYSGKWNGVKKQMKFLILFGWFLIVLCSLFMIIAKVYLIKYFFQNKVLLQDSIIIGFGSYYLIRVWTDYFAMLLAGLERAKEMFHYTIFQAIISIIAQVILVRYFGLLGIMLGLTVSFLATVAWLIPRKVYQIRKESINAI